MLETAQKHRTKNINDYGIKHSTLLQACTSSPNPQNHQRSPSNNNYQGSGLSDEEDYHRDQENDKGNNQSSCSPCNEYGVLLKHLRTCPEPEVALPFDIKELSLH